MDAKILQTIERLERFMETVDDALPLPRPAAEFVHALVIARGARRAVEIGTSYGYSGLWIGAALARNDGTLITIDHDPRKSSESRANFIAAGIAACIDVRTGRATELLGQVAGPIDFVLNDADKENCRRYVEILTARLADRAVIVTDNTSTHASELAEFLAWIKQNREFVSATIPVGNGMELSVKLPS